jgi:hypothetical protein
MALGASIGRVQREVPGRILRLALAGLFLGTAASIGRRALSLRCSLQPRPGPNRLHRRGALMISYTKLDGNWGQVTQTPSGIPNF